MLGSYLYTWHVSINIQKQDKQKVIYAKTDWAYGITIIQTDLCWSWFIFNNNQLTIYQKLQSQWLHHAQSEQLQELNMQYDYLIK